MEKNRVLNHSVTHSPSLFDAPGTEALALRNSTIRIVFLRCRLRRDSHQHFTQKTASFSPIIKGIESAHNEAEVGL